MIYSFCRTAIEDTVHFSFQCPLDKDSCYKFFLELSLMISANLFFVLKYLILLGSGKGFNNK